MDLNIQKLTKRFFDRFFYRQHPEAALRYLPVVSIIKRVKLTDAKILEIGSGSLGITPYLKRSVDGLDVDFSGPQTKLLNKIKGSAEKLPFHRNSYDVAIAVDVLEHLGKDQRAKAIYEMLRIAKRLVIIVVPTGKLSERQDRELDSYWQKVFQSKNQYFVQHLKNGLPSTDEILVNVDKSSRQLDKKIKVTSFPSLNLFVRNILMRTWISKNKYLYYLYMKGYLLLLPILRLANFGNCYRRVFMIELAS